MKRQLQVAAVGSLCLVLRAMPAGAQLQTGEIFGKVLDASGAAAPAVMVTLESPALLRPLSVTTSSSGTYRFPQIPIGTYRVTFEHPGFKRLVREDIRIETAFNAEINARLEVSGVEETLTVKGESPVVDTAVAATGGTFNREMLENLPSARDPWVILQMTPGIVMSGQNVGGSQSGQQNGYAARGAGGGNSMWNVDGATITDMAATGASPIYYDFDSFEEIQITTGGSDVSLQTGAVNINMITKSGGNTFHGSGRLLMIDQGLQSDNVTQGLFDQGAQSGNPIQRIKDYGFEIGGPIKKDRLWFWGGYGKQDIKVGVLGFYKPVQGCNPPPTSFDQLDALKDCLETDLTALENYNAKLQYQAAQRHRMTFLFTRGDKIRNARGAGPFNPPETTTRQTGPVNMYKLTHNWMASDRLAFETAAMYVGGGFVLDFHEDALADVQRKFNRTTTLNSRSGSRSGPFDRPTTEIKTDASYFAPSFWGGDHSFKLGLRWRDTPYESAGHIGGNATARFDCRVVDPLIRTRCLDEIPIEADLHRDSFTRYAMWVASVYASDSYRRGRWRLTVGVRYDYQDDEAKPSLVPANPIVPDRLPAVEFKGADSGVTFRDLSPRASVTYDVFGTGKTVLKASYARYFGQGIFAANTLNPVGAVTLRYAWNDANGDQFVQANELGNLLTITGNYNPAAPGSPTTQNQVDPGLKNDRTDEILASVEHELMRNFGVGLSYIYRRYDQFNTDWRVGVSSADFVQATFRETDARFAGTPTVAYFQLRPGVTWPTAVRNQNTDFRRPYHGVELTARRRFSGRWMMNGSLTWNHTAQLYGPMSYQDPTNISFLEGQPGSSLDTRWLAKLGGSYALPWDIHASAFVTGRDGFLANQVVQSPSRGQGLGRIDVMFEPQGGRRYPRIWLMDARLEKRFTVQSVKLSATLDVFNIGNVNTVVSRGNTVNSTNFNRVSQIIAPRVLRLGLRFTF